GQNLSPLEVEEAVASHPDVLEVAVVAVPSELTEDEVKAFVVLAPDTTTDFAALRAWAGERLSAFKVPRYWQQVDALPRTPTQRVAKHRLPGGPPEDESDAEPWREAVRSGKTVSGRGRPARGPRGWSRR